MARTASLSSPWLPTYAWWPHPEEFDLTAVLTPYHVTTDTRAEYQFVLRGYSGSDEPVWEHETGPVRFDEQRAVRLPELEVPSPPEGHGGILEVHSIRLDQLPRQGIGFNAMWIDAHGVDGGGYVIPTIPSRAQGKAMTRDDLQVAPGVVVSREMDTEVVVLNVSEETTTVRLVAVSPDGLSAESRPIDVAPWSAWRGNLRRTVRGVVPLLAASEGIGSLAIYSSHKIIPYFAQRRTGQPIGSLDHFAPIFAAKTRRPALSVVVIDGDGEQVRACLEDLERQAGAAELDVEAIFVAPSTAERALAAARARGVRMVEVSERAYDRGRALNEASSVASAGQVMFISGATPPAGAEWLVGAAALLRDDEKVPVVYGRPVTGHAGSMDHVMINRSRRYARGAAGKRARRLLASDLLTGGGVLVVRRKMLTTHPFPEGVDRPESAWALQLMARRATKEQMRRAVGRSLKSAGTAFEAGLAGRAPAPRHLRSEGVRLARERRVRTLVRLAASAGVSHAGRGAAALSRRRRRG